MTAYHYVAIQDNGAEQKGLLEAENEKHVRQLLREKGLLAIHVAPSQKKTSTTLFPTKSSFNSKTLALMTRQFATLLAAALPVEEALLAVAEQTQKPALKTVLYSVRTKVLSGHSLTQAMREHPESFPALFSATIAAGEKTGHLDKVLLRLADYTEQQAELRQKLTTALIYPAMIILVATGIVGFLLEYVVPKMVSVYAHMDQTLPLLTRILISVSHFLNSMGFYLIAALAMSIFWFRRSLKTNLQFRENTQLVFLCLPLLSHILKIINTARFSRTLSILSVSGVPMLEAMHISAQLITLIPIRKAVDQAVSRVREGAAIHLALKQTQYFSPMSIHMLASGEASGHLEEMLDRIAGSQESEVSRFIDVGLALFEPAVILVMGVIVLFIVLAVLLPIFQLNQFAG